MNRINFNTGDKFPMYRSALVRLQDMICALAQLAGIGGDNYILSGCRDNPDGTVSDGMVVVGGELLPFAGGPKKARITITETRTNIEAKGVVYPEVYIDRVAGFSDTGTIDWSTFSRVQSNSALYKLIKDIHGDAPGVTKEWAGFTSKIPEDHMLCDGRELQISDYPELYDNIGVLYGGDGVTSFRIPNHGGRVVVGYSGNNDYSRVGNTGGEEKHTLTADEIPEHDHTKSSTFNKLSAKASDIDVQSTPGSIDADNAQGEYNVGGMNTTRWAEATIQSVGKGQAHENRQPFIVEAKIIKVR